jgi:hypothetical protein
MRFARGLALALLTGCAAAPAKDARLVVLFTVQPTGVVRSDAWCGESAPQDQASYAVELARVRIREVDASEHELTALLSTLVVCKSGEVLLGERSVARRAASVWVEELDAHGGPSSGLQYGTTKRVGAVAQDVLLALGCLASFGLLAASSDPDSISASPDP